jgi:DNA-binding beta-propeller fold protein YncE
LGSGYSDSGLCRAYPLFFKDIFKEARAFSVTPSGVIYVLDKGTNELIKISPEGKILARTGGFGWSETAFDIPSDIESPSDLRTYVADYGNHRIVYFDGNLNYLSSLQLHQGDDLATRFGYPRSVAIDRFGSLFIVDGENTRIVKISESNSIDMTFGGMEGGKGRLSLPGRLRIGPDDVVYVKDGEKILVYDIYGNFIRIVPFPDHNHFRNFAVCDNFLFVLDSLGVRGIAGAVDTTIAVEGYQHAIDIAVSNGRMYFLTSTGIIVQPVDPIWLRQTDK